MQALKSIDAHLRKLPAQLDRLMNEALARALYGAVGGYALIVKAIAMAPARADVHFLAGDVACLLSRPREARADWRRAAELDPSLKPRAT